jgi:hypothetical protein
MFADTDKTIDRFLEQFVRGTACTERQIVQFRLILRLPVQRRCS